MQFLGNTLNDRVILSRLELMNFHNIPKSFASIMKSSEGGAQMCQLCARIIRLNHFEELGKNHFVSVVNKRAPGGRVSSKEMYQLVLREACNPCRKRFVGHHYRCKQKYDSDSHRHKVGTTSHDRG